MTAKLNLLTDRTMVAILELKNSKAQGVFKDKRLEIPLESTSELQTHKSQEASFKQQCVLLFCSCSLVIS